MRLSRLLHAKSWKYAVGEIFLIVVGVSLALMASAWYEDVQERQEEVLSLRQLKVALETDLARVETLSRQLKQSEQELLELYGALKGDEPLTDEVSLYLGEVATWYALQLRTGPYEEIKNRGFSLISKASLRSALVDLYEQRVGDLQTTSQADMEFSANQVTPYLNEHFVRSLDGEWVPVRSRDSLRSDVYLQNLVIGKLRRLQRWFLPRCQEYLTVAQSLLDEIDTELARLTS
jgi:hypothetical protein